MSIEAIIADCHRRGFRVADLSERRSEPGVWQARLTTRDDRDTDHSTGRNAEVALRNALNEITAGPGSERGREAKRTKKPAPTTAAPAKPTGLEGLLG